MNLSMLNLQSQVTNETLSEIFAKFYKDKRFVTAAKTVPPKSLNSYLQL